MMGNCQATTGSVEARAGSPYQQRQQQSCKQMQRGRTSTVEGRPLNRGTAGTIASTTRLQQQKAHLEARAAGWSAG